ncbi:MAG: PfkB family carbohydrate kinase [Kouleothrix sp.]
MARVARTLGQPVICAGFLGGDSGRLVARLAEHEQLPGEWTWIDGETRTCTILVDQAGHDATVINEVGPHRASRLVTPDCPGGARRQRRGGGLPER